MGKTVKHDMSGEWAVPEWPIPTDEQLFTDWSQLDNSEWKFNPDIWDSANWVSELDNWDISKLLEPWPEPEPWRDPEPWW